MVGGGAPSSFAFSSRQVCYGVLHLKSTLVLWKGYAVIHRVPNVRRKDQKVDTFSAPVQLIDAVLLKAAEKGMTKSGFIRYALALAIGKSEREARELSAHGQVAAVREAAKVRSEPTPPNRVAANQLKSAAAKAPKKSVIPNKGLTKN